MCTRYVALKPVHWGLHPQAVQGLLRCAVLGWIACFLAVTRVAAADPVTAVTDPHSAAPAAAPAPPVRLPPTWDLDGTYLWLGPLGAASWIDARWDSTFGADAAVVVVRERARLALVGGDLGASRWTARGGGRVWVDGLFGTYLLGHLTGVSLGPILEISDVTHPRLGGSVGVWGFAGITPFVRIGSVTNLGMFAEVGIHIALPVLRR